MFQILLLKESINIPCLEYMWTIFWFYSVHRLLYNEHKRDVLNIYGKGSTSVDSTEPPADRIDSTEIGLEKEFKILVTTFDPAESIIESRSNSPTDIETTDHTIFITGA